MRTRTKTAALLLLAAPAAPAAAQSFDGRIGFRTDHVNSTQPNLASGGVWTPQFVGTYNFALMLGALDAQGFTSHGMFNWTGGITVSGGNGAVVLVDEPGNRHPFVMNPVGNGVLAPDGRSISGIDPARNVVGVTSPGDPFQPPVFTEANDSYYSVYRFQITVTGLPLEDIVVTATGVMQAVAGWTVIPNPEGEPPTWIATSFVTDTTANGSFTIHIPAPGAGPLVALGLLATARRRR